MNSKRGYVDVEIGGRKRTLHFSMNFWCHFTESLKINLNDLDKLFSNTSFNMSTIRGIIYSGLVAFDKEEKNNIDYDKYDVGNWLENFDQEQLTKIMSALTQSKVLGNSLNMGLERENKSVKKK
tara:strand:- start:2479 stop:2850 length:372 start_codon:yes stop_codon:yes gene_type:complete